MAWYKYLSVLTINNHEAFDKLHQPGIAAPAAGIYRCEGCGHEIGIAAGHTLPPQGHHTHSPAQGTIRWRLTVAPQH